MLLTESYRKQQSKLHESGSYGLKGHYFAQDICNLAASLQTIDVLDYGCGQETLAKSLAHPIRQYDPCIEKHSAKPEPADLVTCTDVLEHIEPDCLDAVLDDLHRLTRKAGFFTVDTRPARKFLDDGRNAHLIQQPSSWWFPKFYRRWQTVQITDNLLRPEKSVGLLVVVRGPRSVFLEGN